MEEFEVYVRNFVHGARGPSSAILVRIADRPFEVACGTVFYYEVPGGEDIKTASQGLKFCEANGEFLWKELQHEEDTGVVPGWSGRPWTEQQMIDQAMTEAGWEPGVR